ncbi:unnamed protein product [Peronospora belbahrii]|uniref:Serine aminopeptidase S33 domain-containing protein n=1 Tax=Peronospora belbahrii TaxID=622444 RepID=A0AAU9KUC7_9STRA|nr:unnamed protein product [Peronospora belbahrii]CAH0514175.1 unnamed protein product [Peronospora belbahrii]
MLSMSVILEEPANMRESCQSEQEIYADDDMNLHSNGSLLEKLDIEHLQSTLRSSYHTFVAPDLLYESESESKSGLNARSASSSASTAPLSSSDEQYNTRTLQSQSRSSRTQLSRNQSSKSRARHRETLTRYARDPRCIPSQNERSLRLEPEHSPHLKLSNSSSPEEEKESYDHHGRPYRRNTSVQSTDTRSKASSIPQPKVSSTSRDERRRSPSSLYSSSSKEMHRSKSSVSLDYLHSTFANDTYEHRQKEESRQAPQSLLRSSERCSLSLFSTVKEVNGKYQLPPFRKPSCAVVNDILSSKSSSEQTSAKTQMHRQMPPRHFAATSSCRTKSSSPSNLLAGFSKNETNDDRRERPIRDAIPSPRKRLTSSPKPISPTYAGEQREAASCGESKMPVTPNSKLCAKLTKDKHHPSSQSFLSRSDAACTRSTSVLPKKSSTHDFRKELTPLHSASTSNLPSLASTPSPRKNALDFPLRLRHYEGRFLNRRRQTLFYFSLFPPEKMPMRGVVVSVHGIGDHCRRNVHVYERLCREGFGVITYDLLNHGVSNLDQQKTRAHISNFNHLVDDTNDFITFAKRSIFKNALRYWRKHHCRYHPHGQKSNPDSNTLLPELPLIIAGVSFGSLIGIYTVLSGEHKFEGAVWSSPTIGVTWNPILWAESKIAKPLVAIIPKAKLVPAFQYDLLSRDPKFLKRYKADPLTCMDMMTTRSGHESLQAILQLHEDSRVTDPNSAFCAVPMLFLAGSADGISDQQAAIKFFATMGNFDKEFKLFKGLFHLVYEEPEKEDVYRYLVQWLHRRFPDTFCH